MNSEDLDFILLEKFPELLSVEEREDFDFKPGSFSIPDMPSNFRRWYKRNCMDRPRPEAMERKEFESRLPALGLTLPLLDELNSHLQIPQLRPVQRRYIFKLLRGAMLSSLIPCSDCSTAQELLCILR